MTCRADGLYVGSKEREKYRLGVLSASLDDKIFKLYRASSIGPLVLLWSKNDI